MAKLCESRCVWNSKKPVDIKNINLYQKGTKLVIVSEDNLFQVYDIKLQRICYEKKFDVTTTISCIPVYNTIEKSLMFVTLKTLASLLPDDNVFFDKICHYKLPKTACNLLSCNGHSPLIVYQDGQLSDAAHPDNVFGEKLAESQQLCWSWCDRKDSEQLITIIVSHNHKHYFARIQLVSHNQIVGSHDVTLLSFTANVQPLFCAKCIDDRLTLFLYTSKTLHSTSINVHRMNDTRSDTRTVMSLSDITALCAIDDSQLLVAGLRQSDNSVRGVGVYNARHDVVQSWQPMNEPNQIQQLICESNQLYAVTGRSVWLFNLLIESSNLRALLGIMSADRSQQTVYNDKKDQSEINLADIADTSKTPTYASFQLKFSELKSWCTNHSSPNSLLALRHSHNLINAVNRILNESAFWPSKEIEALIHFGLIPTNKCNEIIKLLSNHGELHLVLPLLNHVPDISESTLVTCLHSVMLEKSAITTEDKSLMSDEMKSAIINRTLMMPFNDVFLLEALRQLSLPHVLKLLSYLVELLKTSVNEQYSSKGKKELGIVEVSSWISLVIDAHYAQLLLETSATPILVDLHQVVDDLVQLYDELVGLEALLTMFKDRRSLRPQQHIGDYCIQTIHIR